MPDKILVTGATGNVGGEVLRRLAALGQPVRALIRNRAKAAAIEGAGIEIVEGDLEKPETLGPAVQGVRKIVLISALDPRQAELQANLIDAARRADIPHIVKMSAFGAAPASPFSFGRWDVATEQYL